MIKICSLDFINKEKFETDVLTEDGKVLVSGSDKITPDVLLKLYYKSIYIEKALEEKLASEVQEVEEIVPESELATVVTEEVVVEVESTEVQPEEVVVPSPDTILPVPTEIPSIPVVEKSESKDEKQIGPREALPEEVIIHEQVISEKGPKQVESSFTPHEEEEIDPAKGPRIVDVGEGAKPEERKIYQQMKQPQIEEPEAEIPEIKPEDMPLEFNEEEAKKIVENSIKIGKMLNFSQKELKELEKVAYYSNIGISKFKRKDIDKKSFRKMKAQASYQKIVEEGLISEDLAEIVKHSASAYSSDTFPLNSKIPYHHIVAITGYYEDALLKNDSKDDILLKMLQLGGNQFNIFVLHKFINLMREK